MKVALETGVAAFNEKREKGYLRESIKRMNEGEIADNIIEKSRSTGMTVRLIMGAAFGVFLRLLLTRLR